MITWAANFGSVSLKIRYPLNRSHLDATPFPYLTNTMRCFYIVFPFIFFWKVREWKAHEWTPQWVTCSHSISSQQVTNKSAGQVAESFYFLSVSHFNATTWAVHFHFPQPQSRKSRGLWPPPLSWSPTTGATTEDPKMDWSPFRIASDSCGATPMTCDITCFIGHQVAWMSSLHNTLENSKYQVY